MKTKQIIGFLLISFLLSLNLFGSFLNTPTAMAGAQTLTQTAEQLAEGSPISSPEQILRVLEKIVRWTYTIFFIVAIFFILVAAFNFLTAQGETEKVKSARNQILWASIAIAIALISVAAAQIIQSFISNP